MEHWEPSRGFENLGGELLNFSICHVCEKKKNNIVDMLSGIMHLLSLRVLKICIQLGNRDPCQQRNPSPLPPLSLSLCVSVSLATYYQCHGL